MESRIRKFQIKRDKYTVYVWNDCSGWHYWKNEGLNYIQITAHINAANLTDDEVEQLKDDIDTAYYEFEGFHNIDEYIYALNSEAL